MLREGLVVDVCDLNGDAALEGGFGDNNPKDGGVCRIVAQCYALAAVNGDSIGGIVGHCNCRLVAVCHRNGCRARNLLAVVTLDGNALHGDILAIEFEFQITAQVFERQEIVRGVLGHSHHRICTLAKRVCVGVVILLHGGQGERNNSRLGDSDILVVGVDGVVCGEVERCARNKTTLLYLIELATICAILACKLPMAIVAIAGKNGDFIAQVPAQIFVILHIGTSVALGHRGVKLCLTLFSGVGDIIQALLILRTADKCNDCRQDCKFLHHHSF